MTRLLSLALALTLAAPLSSFAQDKGGGDDEKKDPFKDFGELTEDAEVREGFFDTYQKADKLYMAVPQDRLGEDFLMIFEIAQGIGAASLFGGTMLDIFEGHMVALERHGDKVYLLKRPHRYVAAEGSPEEAAVELTYGSSVLASAKIESIREDSAVVIDTNGWFVSDLSDVGQRVRFATSRERGQPGSASFDGSRSYLESVKAFPDNVNIRAKLTFKTTRPAFRRTVPDQRYLPVSVHYTLAKLPEDPMTPRVGDDRMGYFLTTIKDFSRSDTTYFVRYINRWRLEPGERVGDLVRPKKPIIYHLDRNIPEEFRQAMIDGVNAWTKAFEKAGWVDAIRAEMLPDDADAEDIRYATLRWNVSDQNGYGAIGPSVVDPRTGEILDADLLFEAQFILNFKSNWRTLVDPTTMLEAAFNPSPEELEFAASGGELAIFGTFIEAEGALLRTILAARGEIEPGDPVPPEFMNQVLKWITMHEVGHSLGLHHAFGSSKDTPLDKLHDRAWTERNGVTASVMDYHAVNLAPTGQENGYYYTPGVGSYDEWIISYGYTPDDARAKRLARQSGYPGHSFGSGFEAFGPGALDPTVNIYDLSDDPLAWGIQRAELIGSLFPQLAQRVLTDNSSYYDLTLAYNSLLGQYAFTMFPAIKYIGGQYSYNTHVGDENDHGPFRAVPAAEQRAALDFIVRTAFSEKSFQVPREVLQKFGTNRWLHWGSNLTFNGRLDYPFYEVALGIQTNLLNNLTHPFRLSRIRDAELKFGAENVVTIPDLFASLTQAIWSEVWTAPGRNISTERRDLERAYIERMTQILLDPPDRTPADARAIARVTLQDLHTRLTRRLTPPYNFDAYTYAHLSESKARIEKTLEASLTVDIEN